MAKDGVRLLGGIYDDLPHGCNVAACLQIRPMNAAGRSLDMRTFDFMPVLFATMAIFVLFATARLFHDWPDAHNGLVLFERTCPVHSVEPAPR